MTSTPSSEGLLNQKPSVTAGSAPPSSGETCNGNAPKCGASTQTPKSLGTSGEDSTGSARDSSPYWSEFTGGISSLLWLPTGTGSPGSDLNSSSGWSSKTAGRSWFSTSRMPAPQSELTEDLLAVLHTFSCRMHGLRRYRTAIEADSGLSQPGPEEGDSWLAGRQPLDL